MRCRIFSSNNIQKENTNMINVENDCDLFCTIMESMTEVENEAFQIQKEHLQVTYLGLKESNVEILTEGASDFLNRAAEFFKRLMEKIKGFFKKVLMYMSAYMGDFKKFLTTYKNELNKLDPEFEIRGYKYTIPSEAPVLDPLKQCVNNFNTELDSITTMKKAEIIQRKTDFISTENMDKLRGAILGISKPIEEDSFSETVRKTFRNGETDTIDITVDKSVLSNAIAMYETIEKQHKEVCKSRDELILLIDKLQNYFNKSASVVYRQGKQKIVMSKIEAGDKTVKTNGEIAIDNSNSKLMLINTYYNFKFVQSKEIGNITTLIAVEKANALKEQMKMTKDIIRKSLSVNRQRDKEGV